MELAYERDITGQALYPIYAVYSPLRRNAFGHYSALKG